MYKNTTNQFVIQIREKLPTEISKAADLESVSELKTQTKIRVDIMYSKNEHSSLGLGYTCTAYVTM